MNDSTSSLSAVMMVQMVFALGVPLPAEIYLHEVEPSQEQVDVVGDLTNQLDLFVLVERPQETLREQLPVSLKAIDQDPSGYPIQFLQKWGVVPLLFPLDNIPSGDSVDQKTSLSEAKATLMNFWREFKFAPLDAFSFAEVVNTRDGDYAQFLERLRLQYQPYFHTVIILFADQVRLGQEEYHVVLRIDEGCQRATLTAYPGDKTFNLAAQQREVILMACVPAEAVILRPDFVRPNLQLIEPKSQALPSAPALAPAEIVDYENDPRYALRFSDWTNSGLTRDEFVQKMGANAYVLVDTTGIK